MRFWIWKPCVWRARLIPEQIVPRFDAGMKAKLNFLVSEYQPITRDARRVRATYVYFRHFPRERIWMSSSYHPHFVLFNLFPSPPPSLSLEASRASHRMICIFGKKKKEKERHIAATSILQVRWEISRERCRDKSFLASIVRALDRATFS